MSARRVESVDQFVDEGEGFFQVANHYQVPSTLLLGLGHHFLLSEVRHYTSSQIYRVAFIHYQPPPENSGSGHKGMVLETYIKFQRLADGKWKYLEGHEGYYDLLERGEWTRVVNAHYPETMENRDDAASRAKRCIGLGDYSFFSNNCEHFVTRMLTGEGISYQVEQAMDVAAASSVGLSVVVGAVTIAAAHRDRSEESDEEIE